MNKYLLYVKNLDYLLLINMGIILFFGLSALYSIALSKDVADFSNFKKQLFFIGVGIIIMFFVSIIDYRFWKSYAKIGYVLAVVCLLTVLLLGKNIRGTTGWFVVGGYQFQAIEFIKILFIIFLAYYFSSVKRPLYQTKHILTTLFALGLLFLLTLLQPDLGSAMMLIIVWLGIMFLIGLKAWQWGVLILLFLILLCVGWFVVFEDYQKNRVITLFNQEQDLLGEGYSVKQSVIAIGSGRLFGSGLGFGSQSQLKFLPESHTDFVFSVIAEELGFVGVFILILFILLFNLRIIFFAKKVEDDFAVFYLLGVVVLFFSQTCLNIGVALGLLPVTGVTLPLVSYGGSSLIANFIILGIVQSIHIRYKL